MMKTEAAYSSGMNTVATYFDPREIRGCSPADLLALEAELNGGRIPEAVRAHLLSKGRKMAWFHPLSQCYFPDTLEATRFLHAQWRKSKSFPGPDFKDELPSDALVLVAHGGYQWWWISCAEGPDPMVYYYEHDGEADSFQAISPFSSWTKEWENWMAQEFERFLPGITNAGEANFKKAVQLTYDMLDLFAETPADTQPHWDRARKNYERLSGFLYEALLGKKAIAPVSTVELDSHARVDHLLPNLEPREDLGPARLLALSEEVREAIRACKFR
jgi:hypothetical protein